DVGRTHCDRGTCGGTDDGALDGRAGALAEHATEDRTGGGATGCLRDLLTRGRAVATLGVCLDDSRLQRVAAAVEADRLERDRDHGGLTDTARLRGLRHAAAHRGAGRDRNVAVRVEDRLRERRREPVARLITLR